MQTAIASISPYQNKVSASLTPTTKPDTFTSIVFFKYYALDSQQYIEKHFSFLIVSDKDQNINNDNSFAFAVRCILCICVDTIFASICTHAINLYKFMNVEKFHFQQNIDVICSIGSTFFSSFETGGVLLTSLSLSFLTGAFYFLFSNTDGCKITQSTRLRLFCSIYCQLLSQMTIIGVGKYSNHLNSLCYEWFECNCLSVCVA